MEHKSMGIHPSETIYKDQEDSGKIKNKELKKTLMQKNGIKSGKALRKMNKKEMKKRKSHEKLMEFHLKQIDLIKKQGSIKHKCPRCEKSFTGHPNRYLCKECLRKVTPITNQQQKGSLG